MVRISTVFVNVTGYNQIITIILKHSTIITLIWRHLPVWVEYRTAYTSLEDG